MSESVRIGPLDIADRTPRQAELLEPVLGPKAPNLFATVIRNEALYEPWQEFCMKLLRRSALSRREREVVIVRTASRCGSAYELAHHEAIAERAGVTPEAVQSIRHGRMAELDNDDRLLVRAVDELVDGYRICDETWAALAARFDEKQLVEFPMLVGHYVLLAMTLNGLRVPLDQEGTE